MSILVVGSVALDSIRTPFGEVEEILGGSATYFSVAASFFNDVRLVAVVGEDFPPEHVDFLVSRKVDIGGLKRVPGKTFRWKGYYEFDLNDAHTTDTQLNVFEDFDPEIPEEYRDSEYVFLANIHPALQLKVLQQIPSPRLVICDTMNFWIENQREALLETISHVDYLLLNDAEARQLAGEPNLVAAGRKLLTMGPSRVVIKKGEHGVIMLGKEVFFSLPAYPLETVFDPTGAGDSFGGGFLGSLSRYPEMSEEDIRRSIVYGSVIASYDVESFSCNRLRELTMDEIEKRYREFTSITCF
ncbi:MAG: PfkB family carbohydrate kinase [Actinomycetota bacterium]|nr:PfkB family carbohydrate kinase [Actinomycetota bacterium]MDD5666732.1 PfkB family carbohydrate kinase [Actinomycetota bacterium]